MKVSHGRKTLALKRKCECSLCDSYRERIRAQKRASYHRNPKPNRTEYQKIYYRKNREYFKNYYEDNKERYLEHFNNTYRRDKETSRLKKQKRRAIKFENLGEWPCKEKEYIEILHVNQKGLCYYCRKQYGKDRHIEHKNPLSRGGMHDYRNVVLSCASCNLEKGNKTEEEYREFLDTKIPA